MRSNTSSLFVLGLFGGFCLLMFVRHQNLLDSSEVSRVHRIEKAAPINEAVAKSYFDQQQNAASSSSGQIMRKQLLLITKGRSGSSFTSALVNNDSQVFYTYEPLFPLVGMNIQGEKESVMKQRAYDILRGFVECDFSDITGHDVVSNEELLFSGPEVRWLHRCFRNSGKGKKHLDCLHETIKACREKMTFAKLIRFPVSWAEPLIQRLPHLKILFLIRDPRAVLQSQSRVFKYFKLHKDVDTIGKEHCVTLEADIVEIERLNRLYPGRIHVIKYERGAQKQMEYAKDIYKFAGLNFTKKTEAFVESLSKFHHTPGMSAAYEVHRVNGSNTMKNWRNRVSFDVVQKIDTYCAKVYDKMGYKAIASDEDLRSDSQVVLPDVPIERDQNKHENKN